MGPLVNTLPLSSVQAPLNELLMDTFDGSCCVLLFHFLLFCDPPEEVDDEVVDAVVIDLMSLVRSDTTVSLSLVVFYGG